MAATVKIDLVDGHEANIDEKGVTQTRIAKIRGLTASANILYDAVQELRGAGIDYASEHENWPGIFVTNLKPMHVLNSRTQVKILITYKTPDPSGSTTPLVTTVNFHSSIHEVTTERYPDRKIIFVQFTKGNTTRFQIGRAQGTKATGILECTREIPHDPTAHLKMLNKINSGDYRGQPKWSWLVQDVDIEKILHRPGFRERIQIIYDEDRFVHPVLYTDPDTGQVPQEIVIGYDFDAVAGNGYVNVLLNPEADLEQLNIPEDGTGY